MLKNISLLLRQLLARNTFASSPIAGFKPESRCPFAAFFALLLGIFAPVQSAVIVGRVEEAGSGSGIDGANLILRQSELGCFSRTDGSFLFTGVSPGSWIIQASHIGYETASHPILINSEIDTLRIDFTLAPRVIRLEETVFTATRTLKTLKNVPVQTELITRQDFQRRGAVTVADALETEIGYEVAEDFSGQGIMLQGADPDKVLILIDGNRVIGRVNGSIDLEQISVTNVKQIEVVKGSVSTLYGSEAIGGVINIVTDQPSDKLRIRADLSGNGYFPNNNAFNSGSFGGSNGISATMGLGEWAVAVGTRVSRQGLVDITPSTAHTTGTPGTFRFNGDIKISRPITPNISLTTSLYGLDETKDWIEDSGQSSISLAFDDLERNQSLQSSVEILHSHDIHNRVGIKLYQAFNRHRWEKRTQAQWGPIQTIDYSRGDENYTEVSSQLTRTLTDNHLFTSGVDITIWDIESDSKLGNVTSPFSSRLTSGSVFFQDEWQTLPRLTILPGVRLENHEIYGMNVAPRLSAMFAINEETKLRASIGSGYRAPSAKELYYTFNHSAAGYIVYGNPNLNPEISRNYSVSLEHNYRNQSIARISVFYNEMRDLIDFFQTGATDEFYLGTYKYQNIYSAWIRGVEIERGFQLFDNLEIKTSYSFMESYNGLTGSPLLRRPKHSGRWDLTYKNGDWTGKVWGRFTSKTMFTDIFNTPSQVSDEWTIPYEVWNFSINRGWGKEYSVFVRVENIFDKVHGRYGPYEGRTITLGSSWTYN